MRCLMNFSLLIDGLVRQTTVLIAELSTTAGVRAPLAHIADQVFLDLAREIEAQGVGRKVVADMFGLALRSYQKKMRRLTESATERNRTLWQAMLDFLRDGSKTRERIFERFERDGDREVGAVLSDLVSNGLIYSTGRGDSALYGLTSDQDRETITAEHDLESVANVVWLRVFLDEGATRDALARSLQLEPELLDRAVHALVDDGRLTRDHGGMLAASNVVIPLGSGKGWEAAVLDHFRAVATAIAAKARGRPRAGATDEIGGQTFSFSVYPGHPFEESVRALLATERARVDQLWKQVSAHNEQHGVPQDASRVTFYLGQMVTEASTQGEPP